MPRPRLGIGINCFSATEILRHTLKPIRTAHYVVAVVSKESFQGIPIPKKNLDTINQLHSEGFIDEVVYAEYESSMPPKEREISSRNKGLTMATKNGCTHFMTMDEDEIYHEDEFRKAFDIVVEEGAESSYCKIYDYYKSMDLRVSPPPEYVVPFIYKINGRHFGSNVWNIKADSTRKMRPGKVVSLPRDVVSMHHMSWVRDNIRLKLFNSSTYNSSNHELREKMAKYYDSWSNGDKAWIYGHGFKDLIKTQ